MLARPAAIVYLRGMYEDILIETARTMREVAKRAAEAVAARQARDQLGEAFKKEAA